MLRTNSSHATVAAAGVKVHVDSNPNRSDENVLVEELVVTNKQGKGCHALRFRKHVHLALEHGNLKRTLADLVDPNRRL